MSIYGYIRVSSDRQSNENQKLAILEYINQKGFFVDEWISVNASARKSPRERKLDQLLDRLVGGDTVIVSELSRLGRSVGQIAILIDGLISKQIKIICLKEGISLDGHPNIQAKVMITMFSLFAEIEKDLISERTKEGLARARSEGKILGRPKGALGKSKLDGKENEIKNLLAKGVNIANIARLYEVSWPTLSNFINTRRLN